MAGLPPLAPAPGAFPSPSPSNLCLKATSKAGDGQPQPMPATMASKDGGEPQHDTDGVGRVGGQGIYGGEPPTRTDGGGDITMRTDAAGGKRPQTPQAKNDSLVKKRKKHNDPTTIKVSRKSPNPGLRSPMQVTSSPGVNFLVKSAAVKREALKRANMSGSPKTPQPPSCPQLGSPSLDDLSPDTRATNSQASKRKRRKLISDIWKEAEPIYKDGKLVEGKCIHCHEIFAASRDTGTSHMKRHLKAEDAGRDSSIYPKLFLSLLQENTWIRHCPSMLFLYFS